MKTTASKFTANASHIIEPIGQIIARQDAVTQRRLPDEDARSLVFDDTNLFEVSRFSGYDRTEMGTRVNAGVRWSNVRRKNHACDRTRELAS